MIDLALDNSGDLLIENYDLQLVDETDQIAQHCAIRLRFFQGEWFLDNEAGVPYSEYFFIKAPNQIRLESVIKAEILNTEGIEQILAFSSEYDGANRNYSVAFSASTENDEIELEINLP